MTFIIDAGPCLNFFATNNERILISVVGRSLYAPEIVKEEVERICRREEIFKPAWPVWKRLEMNGWITVLSDDSDPTLLAAAKSVFPRLPLNMLKQQKKDLGEAMVVVHAVRIAESGSDVIVIIDDQAGRTLANGQAERLKRLKAQGRNVGNIRLYSTLQILRHAVAIGTIGSKSQMKTVYNRLRPYSASLVPIGKTNLLSVSVWTQSGTSTGP